MNAAAAPAVTARHLLRNCPTAVLSTRLPDDGWPYGSLVLVATDHDGSPLLLLSGLAEHSRNLAADSRLSLLLDGTGGLADPLTGARLSVLGRAEKSGEAEHRRRFLARHPQAAVYAGFGDFAVFKVAVARAHLVAGFGRIVWLDATELLLPPAPALSGAESGIIEHMNADHADALALYATRLLGRPDGDWRMTGCDAEGCDLRCGGETARLAFASRVEDAAGVRAELVRLVGKARAQPENAGPVRMSSGEAG